MKEILRLLILTSSLVFLFCAVDGIKYCAYEDCRVLNKTNVSQNCLEKVNIKLTDSLQFRIIDPVVYKSNDSEVVMYSKSIQNLGATNWNDIFSNGVYVYLNGNCEIVGVGGPIEKRFHRRGI